MHATLNAAIKGKKMEAKMLIIAFRLCKFKVKIINNMHALCHGNTSQNVVYIEIM